MSGITTHILDTSRGRPAAQVPVQLEQQSGGEWRVLARVETDADGRARLLPEETVPDEGDYRLTFEVAAYFAAQNTTTFYPLVQIHFTVRDAGHHHVPLLLNPFGYSTYRGS